MGPTYNSLLLEQLFFSCLIFLFLSFIFLPSLLFPTFSLFFLCVPYFLFFFLLSLKKYSHFFILYQRTRDDLEWSLVMLFSLFNINLLWCAFSSILFVMIGFYVTLCFFFYFLFFFNYVWMLYIYIYIKSEKWGRGVNCEKEMKEKKWDE